MAFLPRLCFDFAAVARGAKHLQAGCATALSAQAAGLTPVARRSVSSVVSFPRNGTTGAPSLSYMLQGPRSFTGPRPGTAGAPASADKPAEATKPKRGPTGLQRPCDLKGPLATFMGKTEASRVEVIKFVWDYIKRHNLQSPENKRMINADSTLRPLFEKDQVSMFELNKLISKFVQNRPSAPKP
ncbi:DNA topoisomerase domain-containing protein [Besnoitia besnoiti]|uniref:DNA topoisomerase domain-containing protein n=1 Tax=Besnoitia besnoiti TaxID=94643 RepID=A0A2A9MKB7_BESBE|nr:DNA topoisomerase domain-containing protein [Besnoitia besnoiti]PFH38425.1 DNA topoisomerase domain-containing protein [Besnoitia besnoiti]